MIETSKENLCINKLVTEKKEVLFVEGDMIVPDAKPDILNTICTSGIVSVYKKEIQDEKIKLDGNINTYIMYMPDGVEDSVRGLNTNLTFSEYINVKECKENMNVIAELQTKSIECKVLNGRKVSIKATLEVNLKVYQNEEIEVINDLKNENDIQMLKEELKVNSLVGTGNTKICVKDNLSIDTTENIAEILKTNMNIKNRDIKISYNKVLTKAEIEFNIMYLTEENKIEKITSNLPIIGFIDIQNISEQNICDINYEIENIIIKLNSQEEHSIYVEVELFVNCNAYEEKNLNLIQDLYSTIEKYEFNKKQILTIIDKQEYKSTRQIREKISMKDIDEKDLIDVEITPIILKENKINTKILYECEMNLKFIFINSKMHVEIKEEKIPFEFTIENIQNGESLNTNNNLEIQAKDFIIQQNGDVICNIDIQTDTNAYRTANINVIDTLEEKGKIENRDYSIVIYIVKKGDTLWNIAKKFGSTVESVAKINQIEDENKIFPGQKLFIPKYVRVPVINYE